MNFLPFALVDPGPANSSAGFGAGAAGGAQPGDRGAAGEGDLGEVTFPEVDEFDVRYVHGYGKVANVEAGMVFQEDLSGLVHWKIFRGISVRPLGAKTAGGREAAGDAVTLICPFWAKHKKGQEEKVFLVPFLYMRPPSSHTWALLCTQDELGQVQKVRGVPLSEIAGVLPGTREVSGVGQSAALLARVEAFWLRWEKEARSDMVRKVEAEARKVAEAMGEDVASEFSAGGKSSVLPAKRARGRSPKVPAKVPGVSPAGQTSELVRQRSENELLKGKVAVLEEQCGSGTHSWLLCVARGSGGFAAEGAGRPAAGGAQRGHEAEYGWRTREKKLLDELEAARGQRGTKRTAPEALAVPEGFAEDKAWLTQCAVELRTAASSNGHGSAGGQPQASRQGGCAPSVLCRGIGQAAEHLHGQ